MAAAEDIHEAVRPALAAYESMRRSKAAYFTLLNDIDRKTRDGEAPSLAASLQLERLLGAHTGAVRTFTAAMAQVTEPAAREELVRTLSALTGEPFPPAST